MKFEDTFNSKNIDGTIKTLPCTLFEHKGIQCALHETVQVWEELPFSVSEVTTGCKLCGAPKANIKLAIKELDNFLDRYGVSKTLEKIKQKKM